jgi:hypothetical protein
MWRVAVVAALLASVLLPAAADASRGRWGLAPSGDPPLSQPIGRYAYISGSAPVPNAGAKVVLRRRALVDAGGITIARATCRLRCVVGVTVSDGARTVRRKQVVQGSVPLIVTRAGRLRAGPLRVQVTIDGRRSVAGRVRLS